MRLAASLSAALTLAAVASPALAGPDEARIRLAQAAPPAAGWPSPGTTPRTQPGPPTSGWGTPTPAPQAGPAPQPAPPTSGWTTPGAQPQSAAAPIGPQPGNWGGPGGGGGGGRNCMGEIQPLLKDAEEKGKAIQAAAKSKQQPVVCQAFRNLATAEAKLIKYFDDHGAECQIPADAMKARKGNYTKVIEIRTKVCDVAANPAKRTPSLSDALGTSRVPTAPTNSTQPTKRGSTFDTLTGNSLSR